VENYGTINANGGNVSVGYYSGSITNHSGGLLEATAPGSVLTVGTAGTTWTNVGTITASGGGTVDLGGNFTTADLTSGLINGAGGTLNITGLLDNSTTGPLNAPNGGAGPYSRWTAGPSSGAR